MIYLFVFIFILLWKPCELGLRVIGGRDALQDEFPYAVRLELKINESREDTINNYVQFCTGAALTPTWILSAAHCAFDFDFIKRMFIRYNSYLPNNTGDLAPFLETIVHPGYDRLTAKFDILLIRSPDIKVLQYGKVSAVDYKSLVGHEAWGLGFGGTNASLFQKPLQVLKGMLSYCPEKEINTSHMICLVRQCTVEATMCGGDSGGPIVHPTGIVGVPSMSPNVCIRHNKVLELAPSSTASVLSPISPALDWVRHYCK